MEKKMETAIICWGYMGIIERTWTLIYCAIHTQSSPLYSHSARGPQIVYKLGTTPDGMQGLMRCSPFNLVPQTP